MHTFNEESANKWYDAFMAVAHEIGFDTFESVDEVLEGARRLRAERDVVMGDAGLDAAQSTLATLRNENAALQRELEGVRD